METQSGPAQPLAAKSEPGVLVSESECLSQIFTADSRPAPRTWRKWKKKRSFPFVKLGRLSFYDVEAVRAALLGSFTVSARK